MDSDKESKEGTPGPEEPVEDGENADETAEERKKRLKKEKEKAKKKAKAKKDKEKKSGGKDDEKSGEEDSDDESKMSKTAKKDDGKKKKKGGSSLMKELLKLRKEQEERAQRELEEKQRREEEEARLKEERAIAEAKRKEEERLRKEALIAKQKKEGTYLTKAQKQKIASNQRLLLNRDLVIPADATQERAPVEDGAKKKPILYGQKKRPKQQKGATPTPAEEPEKVEKSPSPDEAKVEINEEEQKPESPAEEVVVESWEDFTAAHADDKPLFDHSVPTEAPIEAPAEVPVKPVAAVVKKAESSDDEDEEESEDSSDEGSTDEEPELTAESKDLIRQRLQKRRDEAEARRSTDNLRSPVICVLGHVDTGKTKMLDTIRRTNVQDGEAGGITQQMGATRVPDAAIKERCRHVRDFVAEDMKIPGLLIIDTPGHESFANMRSRGSSLCDFAILVVDIMHGLEPQTIESLKLLLKRKTPFVVALNKVDRLYDYQINPRKDIWQHLKSQATNTFLEFKQRWNNIVGQFSEQGINVALANEKKDPKEYINVVPTSAFNGDGIGNLLAHIVTECQTRYAEKLAFCDELDCTVMEVRSLPGLGMTIDVILLNGYLRVNDVIVLSGIDGPISTQIRDLLMPQPLKEIRVKGEYEHYKELKGAQGVKILAKDLERAVAGLPLFVANREDEVDLFREDARAQLENALTSIKRKKEGVYVQASTLGALEALLEFLKAQKIPYSNVNIGPVHKKDVQKAAAMLEHEAEFACILAFDVPVHRDVQQFADREGVQIFQADIIYHLEDKFLKYREELKQKRRKENEHLAVFPCRLRVLPQHIFNARNPIVVGVNVEAGKLKKGTPIVAKTDNEIVFLGTVSSIEMNHELLDVAKQGDEVSVKIENTTGDAPKMYGRHFTHTDQLMSRITRQSIDVCKQYFRDDLSRDDWSLVVTLKKMLNIM